MSGTKSLYQLTPLSKLRFGLNLLSSKTTKLSN